MSSRSERRRTQPEGLWFGENMSRITCIAQNDESGDADTVSSSVRRGVQVAAFLASDQERESKTPRRRNRKRQADDFPRQGALQAIQVLQSFGGDDDTIKPVTSAQTQAIPLVMVSRPRHLIEAAGRGT